MVLGLHSHILRLQKRVLKPAHESLVRPLNKAEATPICCIRMEGLEGRYWVGIGLVLSFVDGLRIVIAEVHNLLADVDHVRLSPSHIAFLSCALLAYCARRMYVASKDPHTKRRRLLTRSFRKVYCLKLPTRVAWTTGRPIRAYADEYLRTEWALNETCSCRSRSRIQGSAHLA